MSDDPSPLGPSELDELLSADLDGELAAAARDHGSDIEALRARLAATPDAEARRAELAAARELLAEAPEMDELVAARLRAKAVGLAADRQVRRVDARRRRRNRVVMTTSGVAAAIVLVIAVVAAGRAQHGGTTSASGASTASRASPPTGKPAPAPVSGAQTPAPAPAPGVTALGSYGDAHALGSAAVRVANADALKRRAASDSLGSDRFNAGASGADATKTTHAPALPATAGGLTTGNNQSSAVHTAPGYAGTGARTLRCAAPSSLTSGDQLVLRANATLKGEPVTVFVFAGHGDHTVAIVSPSCTLLNVQNLP